MPRFAIHARSRQDARRFIDGEVVTRSLTDAEDIAFERLRRAEGIWADRWRDVFIDARLVLAPVPLRASAKAMVIREREKLAKEWRDEAHNARRKRDRVSEDFWREACDQSAVESEAKADEHQRIADAWRSL